MLVSSALCMLCACSAPLEYFPYYVADARVLYTQGARVCVHGVEASAELKREHPERLERVRALLVAYMRRHDVLVQDTEALRRPQGLCDVLVHPAIHPRQAELIGRAARWDGVEQRIPTTSYAPGAWELDLDGFGPAISLRVQVVDKSGEVVFRSMGGIEVSEAMAWSSQEKAWYWRPRDDLLTDERAIRRAIPLALHPLIKRS
ncbi:MAG: hypothetical protein AAGI01_04775 [Myxococcota bacterium]